MKKTSLAFLFCLMLNLTAYADSTQPESPAQDDVAKIAQIKSLIALYVKCETSDETCQDTRWAEVIKPANFTRASVPLLMSLFQESDYYARKAAGYFLEELGPEAIDAVAVLVGDLNSEEYQWAKEASVILSGIGAGAAPALIQYVSDPKNSGDGRFYGFGALGKIGLPSKELIDVLIRELADENNSFYEVAVMTLGQLGSATVPYLLEALATGSNHCRMGATEVLENLGKNAREAIPFLIGALKGTDRDLRKHAITILENIGEDAVPSLCLLLSNPTPEARHAAAEALEYLGPAAKSAVSDLIRTLQESDPNVRHSSAKALGSIGFDAIEPLTQALSNFDGATRAAAALALGLAGKKSEKNAGAVIPLLIAMLTDANREVQAASVSALGLVSEISSSVRITQEAQAPILRMLADSTLELRRAAVQALSHGDATVVMALVNALSTDTDSNVRWLAADSLRIIGSHYKSPAHNAVPALLQALRDPNATVTLYAAQALATIGAYDENIAPLVIPALADPNPNVRRAVAEALGKMGTYGMTAFAALQSLADSDPVDYVRSAAKWASSRLK